jgi:molybdenum cofactor biosynthesis enzyme MoaA
MGVGDVRLTGGEPLVAAGLRCDRRLRPGRSIKVNAVPMPGFGAEEVRRSASSTR